MTHHTDENIDPLKTLREELADLSPSPEFAAKVRQGIDAAGEMRSASWLSGLTGWRWLVPVGAATVIVVAAVVMSQPEVEAPQQVIAQAPVETSKPVAARQEPVVSSPAPAVSRPGSSKFGVRTSTAGRRAAEPEDLSTREPVLEVITNQPAILRALWAGVDSKAGLVESAAKTSPDTVPEIVVSPIEVNPIVIKWLGDPQTAPGAPIIRRVTADMAERSAK